ncbi:MAG: multidrug transporter [Eggerthellaceae bacterium]|nr:multidrug transporter [Eggerthellaceae bacterium]
MNLQGFTERNWKLFRNRIADWQERHMDRLNREYVELLSGEGAPSEKFWTLAKRVREDKRSAGVKVEMTRSMLVQNMAALYAEGVITEEDLDGFSDALVETVRAIGS